MKEPFLKLGLHSTPVVHQPESTEHVGAGMGQGSPRSLLHLLLLSLFPGPPGGTPPRGVCCPLQSSALSVETGCLLVSISHPPAQQQLSIGTRAVCPLLCAQGEAQQASLQWVGSGSSQPSVWLCQGVSGVGPEHGGTERLSGEGGSLKSSVWLLSLSLIHI